MTDSIADWLQQSANLKPAKLRIDDLKWRYLMRSAKRGKNILLVGPTGCGKTLASKCVVEALGETCEAIVTDDELEKLKADPNIVITNVDKLTES